MNNHLYGEPFAYINQDGFNAAAYNLGNDQDRSYQRQGASGTTEYHVTFKIEYPTKYFEDLFVVGDLPELGNDGNLKKHPLKWTDGHIWVSETPVVTSNPNFRYNYIMIDQKSGTKIDNDEKGIKRICDLAAIESHGGASLAGIGD